MCPDLDWRELNKYFIAIDLKAAATID